MSAPFVSDLESASRYLGDSYISAKNAIVLLERMLPHLAEECTIALTVLDESRDGVRKVLQVVESA